MQDIYFMKQKYYNLILSYPKSTLAFILVTSFFVMAGMLFIKVDNNLMNQLPENIESRTIYESIKEEFGATDFIFIAMGTPGDTIINTDSIKDLWDLTNDLSINLEGIEEVISLTTINQIEGNDGFMDVNKLINNKHVDLNHIKKIKLFLEKNNKTRSQLVSKNYDYFNIIASPENSDNHSVIIKSLYEILDPYSSKYTFQLGGDAFVAGSVTDVVASEVRVLFAIGLLVMIFLLYVNIKQVYGVLFILATIFLSVGSMMGFMGWMLYFTNSKIFYFSLANTSMPIILLTIANSDGVHVVAKFFKKYKFALDSHSAVMQTMDELHLPIFLTSITTTAAFLTLIISPIAVMAGYGVSIGFGILWAWILSISFLPCLLKLKRWNKDQIRNKKSNFLEKFSNFVGILISKYPNRIILISVFLVLVSLLGIFSINVEVNIVKFFKPGNFIHDSTSFIDEDLSGSMTLIVKAMGDMEDPNHLKDIEKLQKYMKTNIPSVSSTISISDIIKKMHAAIEDNNPNKEIIPDTKWKIQNLLSLYSMSGDGDEGDLNNLINEERDAALITAFMKSFSTSDVVKYSTEINNYINNELSPKMSFYLSGTMMFVKDFVNIIIRSSIISILLSILIVFIISFIFFRSIGYAFMSIITLSVAVILNFGLMGLFSVDLSHVTAILSSIIIGVGVDFSIHYICEYKNQLKNVKEPNKVSLKTVENVGYPIILDAISNMAFGALLFSSIIPITHIGGLMVFAMVSTAFGSLTILASVLEKYTYQTHV